MKVVNLYFTPRLFAATRGLISLNSLKQLTQSKIEPRIFTGMK
jgi:hypothetical protein